MISSRRVKGILLVAAFLSRPGQPAVWVPAFPGAEGSGAVSVGGRGGTVIEVTNLNDSGPGSFRAAVEAAGPRMVVFRVGGTIELQSTILFVNPFITIAGQTAPGGGIAFKNSPSFNRYEDPSGSFDIRTHEVIVRHVRIRCGAENPGTGSEGDAIQLHQGASRIMIDHCSLSWAVDEIFSSWSDPHDCTIQWCIFSEALYDSTHSKGVHSMGVLIGSDGCTRMSLHHNLLAHNDARNPRIKSSGVADFVNNLIYNFGDIAGLLSSDYATLPVNYVGNYVKRGPNSSGDYEVQMWEMSGNVCSVYVEGNIGPHRPDESCPESDIVDPADRSYLTSIRHDVIPVRTTSAARAYREVLFGAGAVLPRDVVDQRIVSDAVNSTGSIIDDPSEVGGWPELAAGTPPADSDHDGMSDAWEAAHGLDPDDPTDGPVDGDGDVYTNVEEFLNGTDPNVDPLCGTTLVSYAGTSPSGATLSTAAVGRFYRTDRAYALAALPTDYACSALVQYAEADSANTGNDFIRLSLAEDATVLVAYDARATARPDWLSDWTPTGKIVTGRELGGSGQAVDFNSCERSFASGQTVLLGGNRQGAGDAQAGYLVLIATGCPRPAPTITQQPQSHIVRRGQAAAFSVEATGEGPLHYQWRKDGVDLTEAGHCAGVYSPTLTVSNIDDADVGDYCVAVTDSWCSQTSSEAALILSTPCDYDDDGDVDQDDFGHFQACLGPPVTETGCQDARLDGDPDVDQQDFAVFCGCMSGPGIPAEERCLP